MQLSTLQDFPFSEACLCIIVKAPQSILLFPMKPQLKYKIMQLLSNFEMGDDPHFPLKDFYTNLLHQWIAKNNTLVGTPWKPTSSNGNPPLCSTKFASHKTKHAISASSSPEFHETTLPRTHHPSLFLNTIIWPCVHSQPIGSIKATTQFNSYFNGFYVERSKIMHRKPFDNKEFST